MIKYLLIFSFIILNINFLSAQTKSSDCVKELEGISELIKNAKSYKRQIRRENKKAEFEKWKEEIKKEIQNDSLSSYFCLGYLKKYISFIKDKHNSIYYASDTISLNVPTYKKAIDTTKVDKDSISGIYYMGTDKIMVQKENNQLWYGITLESDLEKWSKGKIRLRIHKNPNGDFDVYEFYRSGSLAYHKDVEISKGRINSTFWNKQNKYFFNKNFEENFTYKAINSSFDYIGIKSLKRITSLMKEADDFYSKYLPTLNKENIIIDLRNNTGGAIKQAKPLIKALKRNKDVKRIYVLINFKTASAAELTALELKKDKRTIIAGENSFGAVEYGYGNNSFSDKTNSSKYEVDFSTKHNCRKYTNYEGIGITPDYKLNNNTDWIEQIVKNKL